MNPTELINLENPVEVIDFALPVVLIFMTILFIGLGIVLAYHWRKYGVGRRRAALFMWIYLIGGAVFLGVMFTAKLSY